MTTEELREIDRRVGEAISELPVNEMPIDLIDSNIMLVLADFWFWQDSTFEIVPLPHFTTDPTAADLVRQEIERRGWMWELGNTQVIPPGWVAFVTPNSAQIRAHCSISDGSPHTALCLAFLAACEAQKKESSNA